MKIFRAKAFAHNGTKAGKPVHGNPATVVLCTEMFPAHEDMSTIAIAENAPMTVFLRQFDRHCFDIEFYTPSGKRFSICGHGTLVAAYFIHQQYGYHQVFFYKAMQVYDQDTLVLKSNFESGLFTVTMPAFVPIPTRSFSIDFSNILGIKPVKEIYLCRELNDIILVLEDAASLRAGRPLHHELAVILGEADIRGLFLTTPSAEPGMDYEVRIFAPHLGINEDISCASANCSLLPFWQTRLQKPPNYQYGILCPYQPDAAYIGGVEAGWCFSGRQSVAIGGLVVP